MFRISPKDTHMHQELKKIQCSQNASISLLDKHIRIIEKTPFLSLIEKLELLLVASGKKLTTEIYENIGQDQKVTAKTNEIEKVLKSLPFSYFFDKTTRNNSEYIWFQVSTNETISHFLKLNKSNLGIFEYGILYGYPLSAIRAYAGLIENDNHMDQYSLGGQLFAGVGSKKWHDEEQKLYDDWLQEIRSLSPTLAEQAVQYISS